MLPTHLALIFLLVLAWLLLPVVALFVYLPSSQLAISCILPISLAALGWNVPAPSGLPVLLAAAPAQLGSSLL